MQHSQTSGPGDHVSWETRARAKAVWYQLGCGRDISQGNAAGWPSSTRTPAQLESPASSTGQEQEQLSTSEGVPVGGLLPKQHFPLSDMEAVGYGQGLNIRRAAAFPAR